MHFTVAIAEDDETMNETLAKWVREMGHNAIVFTTGDTFLKAYRLTEFSLLLLDWALPDIEGIDHLNGVVSRARIIQGLWGSEPMETSRTLDTHISCVRRKPGIAAERGLIHQSVYGLGYRLQAVAAVPFRE